MIGFVDIYVLNPVIVKLFVKKVMSVNLIVNNDVNMSYPTIVPYVVLISLCVPVIYSGK